MKRLLPLLLFLSSLFVLTAQDLPQPQGFVNDFAGILSPPEAALMEEMAAKVQGETGAEIAVVVIESFAPWGSIDEYAVDLFEAWGIGETDKDNGILLLLAMEERRVRIEVGYGLEGILPDGKVGRILDSEVLPSFRDGDFGEGLYYGLAALSQAVLDGENDGYSDGEDYTSSTGTGQIGQGTAIVVFLIFLLGLGVFIVTFLKFLLGIFRFFVPRSGKGGGFGSGTYSSGGFGSSSYRSSSFRSSSGSRSSSFGGGGRSGGFSGGSSGGGGASRGF